MSAFFQLVIQMDFGKIFLVTGYSSIQAFLLTGLTVRQSVLKGYTGIRGKGTRSNHVDHCAQDCHSRSLTHLSYTSPPLKPLRTRSSTAKLHDRLRTNQPIIGNFASHRALSPLNRGGGATKKLPYRFDWIIESDLIGKP